MRVQRGNENWQHMPRPETRNQKPEHTSDRGSSDLSQLAFSQVIQSGTPSETAKKSFQAVGNGKIKTGWSDEKKGWRLKADGQFEGRLKVERSGEQNDKLATKEPGNQGTKRTKESKSKEPED